MTTAELLTEARALVERGWCQESDAKTDEGFSVIYTSPEAVEYCAVGACYAAALRRFPEEPGYLDQGKVLEFLRRGTRSRRYTTDWNDVRGRTKEQVLAAFDRAIELARHR